jgi:hypothetical protein
MKWRDGFLTDLLASYAIALSSDKKYHIHNT